MGLNCTLMCVFGILGGVILKTLLLVTKRKSTMDIYYRELKKVFGDRLDIIPCYHISDDETPLPVNLISSADIVLISSIYSFPIARRNMNPNAKIVNLKFTYSTEKIESLRKFPVGTEALACFNYYSAAQQTVDVLYESGLSNLNLYIEYPGNRNVVDKKIDIAIISGPTDHIPEGIPHIFNLGERKLALSTLLDIALEANILDDELKDSISHYCDEVAPPSYDLSYFYDLSSVTTLQLKTIMECVDYGIAIYNEDYQILNTNQNFANILNLPSKLYKLNLNDILYKSELRKLLDLDSEIYNRLCTLKDLGISISVTKRKIHKDFHKQVLNMLLIKDITELTDMETSLRLQIAQKGKIAKYSFDDIKGNSPEIKQIITKAKKIAQIDKPTLIIGESGTGKELFVQSIHNASARGRYPFVAINCAAIPDTLLESELFGYEDGAFTGARKGGKQGLFQTAQKGTIFLDEIGELSLPTQAKLLRVLEEKEVMRVGSDRLNSVDVRIIAATNRDLKALVDEGKFRLDLFYRLNTLTLNIPPLRKRSSDVPLLISEFLHKEKHDSVSFDPEVWDFLLNYQWIGNVRELRNCIEYAANISDGCITANDLPDYILKEYNTAVHNQSHMKSNMENNINTYDKELLRAILTLLKYKPMGRRPMMQALEEKKLEISEYHIRSLLEYLNQNNYISIGKGRSGCSLTNSGKEFLDILLQQNS